jgi:hypothetical protein
VRVRGVAILLAAVALAGCGPTVVSPTVPAPDVSPAVPSASPSIAASDAPSGGLPSPAGNVGVDASLLDVLPADVAGATRQADAETAAEIAGSAGLGGSVDAVAVALYVGPGDSAADDLAIVSVARLAEGIYSDGWFRAWRDTYDAAACEPAGGVSVGSAEAEIGGRTTFIGTCENGVHTYHVRLTDPDRVVAITSIGEERLGEQVIVGIAE